MTIPAERSHVNRFLVSLCVLLALVSMGLALFVLIKRPEQMNGLTSPQASTSWQRTVSTKTLRIGVGAFPPYSLINPSATEPEKRYAGLSIDMVRRIANSFNPPWKIEYHEINWDTLRADMYSGKFDFIPNVMYVTIARLPEFEFTMPYAYMSVGIGIVKTGDNRFPTFESLNEPKVKISLVQGWTPTELAQSRLPKATLLIRPMDNPAAFQFEELVSGRADVILQDAATARLIKEAHPKEVKLLWLDKPPMRVACSFMLRKGDIELRDFLSQSIETMLVDGSIAEMDRKWKGLTDFREFQYRVGTGVRAANEK